MNEYIPRWEYIFFVEPANLNIPQTSIFKAFSFSTAMDHQEISAVHSVLHLIYHRNKNQHQRAKWWKWLSTLKRTTLDLESLDSAAVERYQQHLAMHLIPRCYLYVQSWT